ncbi:MAG TPA: TIGR04283 family arsenosugar biosynthesis glycosyltransferase [Candidatus Sericytochromatia bacterium]|jgi:rSAM/selenodomain-associated transferase 2
MTAPRISIIIPVLNEAGTIQEILTRLQEAKDVEVIVVDGGSRDETLMIALSIRKTLALSLPIKVISTAAGRANQMNAGAAVASGDILLFLHADTRLPARFDTLLLRALQDVGTMAGAFELRIDAQLRGLRLIEKMVKLRSRFLAMPYGDQAIFLKASTFDEMGGFPDLPIMEDFELMLRLRRHGKIALISAPVVTSGRRWQKLGVVKTTLINQVIIAGYFLGVPPTKLVRWYRQGGFNTNRF